METMNNENVCVIPGTFDPMTNGHYDIILRAAKIFEKVYVVPFDNSAKKTMFTYEERREMLRLAFEEQGAEKIMVDGSDGVLLAEYAKLKGAKFIVKGIRNIMDTEYEFELFRINKEIGDGIDTMFIPAKSEHLFISSTFVREMILYNKDISAYVPVKVKEYINKLLNGRTRKG